MEIFERFRLKTNQVNNNNFKFVKVKSVHRCEYCYCSINTGEECLTVNSKGKNRFWVCNACVSDVLHVRDAVFNVNIVPFGDEGMCLAEMDYARDTISNFLDRIKNTDIYKVYEDKLAKI